MSETKLTDAAINSVAALADKANSASRQIALVPIPNHPDGQYLIVRANGDYDISSIPLGERMTELMCVDQIAPYVNFAIDKWAASPAVYFDTDRVVCRLDESDLRPERRGWAQVQLEFSEQFGLLKDFHENHGGAYRGHKAFMIMLKIDLETAIDAQTLESTLRSLESYESDDITRVNSTVTRNRESLGKDVRSELRASAGEIPSEIRLNVRVFKDPSLLQRRRIMCKIEVDPTGGGKFALLPLGEEITNAIDAEMSDLGDLLRSSVNSSVKRIAAADGTEPVEAPARPFVPVFYGKF